MDDFRRSVQDASGSVTRRGCWSWCCLRLANPFRWQNNCLRADVVDDHGVADDGNILLLLIVVNCKGSVNESNTVPLLQLIVKEDDRDVVSL